MILLVSIEQLYCFIEKIVYDFACKKTLDQNHKIVCLIMTNKSAEYIMVKCQLKLCSNLTG